MKAKRQMACYQAATPGEMLVGRCLWLPKNHYIHSQYVRFSVTWDMREFWKFLLSSDIEALRQTQKKTEKGKKNAICSGLELFIESCDALNLEDTGVVCSRCVYLANRDMAREKSSLKITTSAKL